MNWDRKLAIVTCCLDDWGGSEELWARSLSELMANGLRDVTIYKNKFNESHTEFASLKNKGVKLRTLNPELRGVRKIRYQFADILSRVADKIGLSNYQWNRPVHLLFTYLKTDRPDLVLISQGINFDGLAFANQCLKLKIPYLIVSHKAVDFFWPAANDRAYFRETLLEAKKCLFVSEHNKKLTEEQFGIRLKNSGIVINPVKTQVSPLPYPDVSNGYRLACVGRLFVIDKGQDILIRVLSSEKWKQRDISVTFIGKGPDEEGLKEMAKLLGVENISFAGFKGSLEEIWSTHHALILPSRSEGLPLTMIEAMSLGRTVIATNAGGNQEIVQHQRTGFISTIDEASLDDIMELAWSKREEWHDMGRLAATHMKNIIPDNPEQEFANLIKELLM